MINLLQLSIFFIIFEQVCDSNIHYWPLNPKTIYVHLAKQAEHKDKIMTGQSFKQLFSTITFYFFVIFFTNKEALLHKNGSN